VHADLDTSYSPHFSAHSLLHVNLDYELANQAVVNGDTAIDTHDGTWDEMHHTSLSNGHR
jgi:hypothetical protein